MTCLSCASSTSWSKWIGKKMDKNQTLSNATNSSRHVVVDAQNNHFLNHSKNSTNADSKIQLYSHRFTSNVWSLQNHRLLHGALGRQQSPKARSIRLRHGNHPELEGYRLQRCVFLRQHVRVFCWFLLFGSSWKQIGEKRGRLNLFFSIPIVCLYQPGSSPRFCWIFVRLMGCIHLISQSQQFGEWVQMFGCSDVLNFSA